MGIFTRSILAGIFISLGGIVYLKVGGALGAFMFSFGLLSVVHYSLPLFTGRSGFCKNVQDIKSLPVILFGNVIGAFLVGFILHFLNSDLSDKASLVIGMRYQSNIIVALFNSIMCGLIMTTVVTFAKKKSFIPLLIGVPLFIISGFWHSIADAFYYSLSLSYDCSFFYIYPITVIGNYFGCNIYNIFSNKSFFYIEESC